MQFVSEFTEISKISHFIFDKRSLRTFHQPSMEWYFAIWKPSLKHKGLVNHYKILPELEWFSKAVEAGKHEIFEKYGKDILSGISVTYINTIEEVIEKLDTHKKIICNYIKKCIDFYFALAIIKSLNF